ncbi:hypothetical protein JOD69_004396 [Methylocaldum sp. RMAD-M]|nr:hypothetical protein [Methylocaldum sp. RMAD-M]
MVWVILVTRNLCVNGGIAATLPVRLKPNKVVLHL